MLLPNFAQVGSGSDPAQRVCMTPRQEGQDDDDPEFSDCTKAMFFLFPFFFLSFFFPFQKLCVALRYVLGLNIDWMTSTLSWDRNCTMSRVDWSFSAISQIAKCLPQCDRSVSSEV